MADKQISEIKALALHRLRQLAEEGKLSAADLLACWPCRRARRRWAGTLSSA